MVVCGKCNAENPDEAKFCEGCGESLVKLCPRCKTQVSLKAKFCGKCAMPLDGSYVCSSCGEVVAKDLTACSNCGKNKSGQSVCSNCGEVCAAAGDAFCASCGTPYKTFKPAFAKEFVSAPVVKNSSAVKTVNKPLMQLIIAWVMTGVMALLFAFSFLPIFKYSTSIENINIEGNISAVDIFEATYRIINPPTSEELNKELEDFVRQNVSIGSDANAQEQAKEIIRLYKEFGLLKMQITKESVKTQASTVLQITFWAAGIIALMATTLIFFIISLYGAIKLSMLTTYKPKNISSVALSLAFGLSLILGLLGIDKFGGGLIAIMLVSCLAIAGLAVLKYITKQEKINVKALASQGASIALVIIISALVMGGSVAISAKDKSYTYKGSLNPFEQISGIDYSKRGDVESPLNNEETALKEYVDGIIASLESLTRRDGGMMAATMFDPMVIFTFKETREYIPLGATLSILNLLGYLVVVAGLGGMAIVSLKDIGNAKNKKRHAFNVMMVAGLAALLVSAIITVISANVIAKELSLAITYSIGAALVTAVIFAVGQLTQNCALIPKNKKS